MKPARMLRAVVEQWSHGRLIVKNALWPTGTAGLMGVALAAHAIRILRALERTRMIIFQFHPNGNVVAAGARLGGRSKGRGFTIQIKPATRPLLARRPV